MFQYAKARGQKRKFRNLFKEIDNITPRFNFVGEYEHYHIPCGFWISSPKTAGNGKRNFAEDGFPKHRKSSTASLKLPYFARWLP